MISNEYITLIEILSFFLIFILDYLVNESLSEKNRKDCQTISKGKSKNKTVRRQRITAINQYLKSISFASVLKAVLIAFIGAVFAVRITMAADTFSQEKQVLHNLEYVCNDVNIQGHLQKEKIEKYDKNQITSEDLRLNSQIDLTFISEYLYSSSTIENIPKSIYALMLNNCRTVSRYNDYLKSGIALSDEYLKECCEEMAECAIRISEEGQKWLQYKNKQISEEDLSIWLNSHLQEIRAKYGDLYLGSSELNYASYQ